MTEFDDDDGTGWPLELGVLKVAAPCKADWNAMEGNAQVRFCGHCKLNVYNLSGMTADAARAVVKASEGQKLCVRFFQRPDGTVTVAQCPPGLSARTRKRWAAVAASGTAALALSLLGVELLRADSEPGCAYPAQREWSPQEPVFTAQPPAPSSPAPVNAEVDAERPLGREALMGSISIPRPKENRAAKPKAKHKG